MLPVASILTSLLARSRARAHQRSSSPSSPSASPKRNRTRTPFVQPQTLSSPTDRLITLAQSINLDVSLDNEDPSFGMSTGNEAAPLSSVAGATDSDDVGNVTRVDTLALAGQRMVIDIEVAHPSPAATRSLDPKEGARGKGWTVNSLRVERVDPEHLAPATGGDGMDVDLPPAASSAADLPFGSEAATPGTRLLEEQSLVLKHYLQKYFDAVNLYDDAERHWHTYHETLQPDDEESLQLQAERAILAFGDELADLRGIDLRMQPLNALLGATATMTTENGPSVGDASRINTDVDMDGVKSAAGDQVILWDQLNEIHSLLNRASELYLSIPQPPSILPQFHPSPEPTFLVNPLCRIVLSETTTAARFCNDTSNTDFTGWAIALDEPVLVSKGFFEHTGTSAGKVGYGGMSLPERGVEDLCGVDRSRSYTYEGSSGIRQAFLFPHSGNAGMMVDYIGIRSKEDILSTSKALRNAIWTSHLLNSCISHLSESTLTDSIPDQRAQEENLDDELEELLTSSAMGSTSKPRNLTIIVQSKCNSLDISFPIAVPSINTQNPIMLNLVIQPNANAVNVTVSTDSSGDAQAQEQMDAYLKGRLNGNGLAERLASFKGDVPRWLDTICTDLYG
ncbi:hypothetical protein QFC21_007052 [Naganishia friedmannii]|uniref:Uncharacterized protein n=1 Tax=Naganishia friedmannii TaxID=89922 RepID=A0ACC2UXP8_9TREE|nr:hypothetical protein QFC21_007052 [Naganishia friedmannii]